MQLRKGLDWWTHRAWIKFGCLISVIMVAAILICWQRWSMELKIVASIAALIPIHVLEEWVFPGGFHYQYNCVMKSDHPECYPMNRLSDMLTNLIATLMYVVLTAGCCAQGKVSDGIILGTMIFCGLEFFMHTMFGCVMYKKFKDCGKTTIYGPGSITAYFGFTVLGILCAFCLKWTQLTLLDWSVALAILLFIGVGCILLPENLLKSKNHPLKFENNGYYDRFLK